MFRIVGGHLALDLINTVAPRETGGDELIGTPDELRDWAHRVRLVADGETVPVSPAAVADTIEIREATYAVLTNAPDAADALARLHSRWAEAMSRARLVADPPGARLMVGMQEATRIPDRLAQSAIDLLVHTDLTRLRECPQADGGCGWLFLDRSRNGTRRWCTMADCGTHAKSRRLTERRRARRSTSRPAAAG